MDKKLVGLVGAMSAALPMTAAQSATTVEFERTMSVQSYAELLAPVPNARALLETADALAQRARETAAGREQVAQWGGYYYHHHHHHHNNYWRRRRYHHHHHHHHHHWYHHHHHHHHYYW